MAYILYFVLEASWRMKINLETVVIVSLPNTTINFVLFPVFQNFLEDPPFHRVRWDLGGPGPGSGHQQTDRHQQGYGGPKRLRVEKIIWNW